MLERVAGTYNLYIEYKDLAETVQQDSGITTGVLVHHWIGSVLGAVARERRAPDEPMLSSLCVRADGTIGAGYGESVLEREGAVPEDLDLHAAAERLACYRYFGANLPENGGAPTLTATAQDQAKPSAAPARACSAAAMPDLLHRGGGVRRVRDLRRVT